MEEHSNKQRTPYLFTAKELDEESQLYYFGARYYDPRTSVWQSVDPVLGQYLDGRRGFGGVLNPLNLNLYAYSHLSPVVLSDPDGKSPESKALIIGGFVIRGTAWLGQGINVAENVVTAGAGLADDAVVIPGLIALDQVGKGLVATGLAMEANEALNESAEGNAGGETEAPPLPDILVGDQSDPRAGPNQSGKRHTSGPLSPEHGGTGDFEKDLETLGGNIRPWQPGDSAPPGSLVGENGVFGRPKNSSGGASIDVPSRGDRPHETLHY